MKTITAATVRPTRKGQRIELPAIYRYDIGELHGHQRQRGDVRYMVAGGTMGQALFSKDELLVRIGELLDEIEAPA